MSEDNISNRDAKPGHLFVCPACGKTSYDMYGFKPRSSGWDESCSMHAVELPVSRLVLKGTVVVEVLPEN